MSTKLAEPWPTVPALTGATERCAVILVVEDDTATRRATCELLAGAGYRILEAATGLMALDLARRERPHLVLLDLGLPEVNGLDVARLLNQQSLTAAMPVVALTGSWLGDAPQQLHAAGFTAALRKPAAASELLALVERLIWPSSPRS